MHATLTRRPILVALVCTKRDAGLRTYTAFSREGAALESWTSGDHGQGAHLCQQACLAAGYRPSSAEWTFQISRTKGHRA